MRHAPVSLQQQPTRSENLRSPNHPARANRYSLQLREYFHGQSASFYTGVNVVSALE